MACARPGCRKSERFARLREWSGGVARLRHVSVGSKGDIPASFAHFRFTPKADIDRLCASASGSLNGWRSTNFMLPLDMPYQ
jgi:hypothetical protein